MKQNKKILTALLGAVFLSFWPGLVLSHQFDYGAIISELTVEGDKIALKTVAPLNLAIDPRFAEKQKLFYEELIGRTFRLYHRNLECSYTLYDLSANVRGEATFEGVYLCSSGNIELHNISLESELFAEYFENYDHYISMVSQKGAVQLILNPDKTSHMPDSVESDSLSNVISRFIALGIEHIILGFDHILFVLSVILLATSVKRAALLVTVFTVAHSITLILAGNNLVFVPEYIVEPFIALSISYVAVQNIRQLRKNGTARGSIDSPLIVFGFGLFHGLGFAGALRDALIPKEYFIPALLSFNIGIEIGQMAIVLAVLPLLLILKNRPQRKTFLIAVSAVILFVSLIWLVQRLI
jgi:hydrogenase/urease accessory protein HupE